MEPIREHPQGLAGTLAMLRSEKGGKTEGERCGRSDTQSGSAEVKRDLGSMSRVIIQLAQGRSM